jgi:ATP-dependent protease ClpP protease subunit
MGRPRHCWNTATPEQIATRSRAPRPALAAPDGAENWYRITNAMEPTENPCLYLYGDIGSWGITAAQCIAELSEMTAPAIDVYISSPGGEVFEGLALYSALRAHRAKIMVRIDSLAASIASVIAMAGDRVTISPGAQVMIHDANTVVCGDPAELRKCADFLDAQSDNIAAIYQERAGGTVKQWRSRMVEETWYFADEAVAAGLADEVAKPVRQDTTTEAMAASWDLKVYNYAHTGRDDAPAPPLATAAPTHHTATVDSPWDAGPNERRLPSPMTTATAKKAYGWYDPAQVEDSELPKAACKFPHHEVDGDGTPGAANLAACRNGLARLPQSDVPEDQRAAVEAHLRAHLADGDSGSEDHTRSAPTAAAFDPAAFRTAATAALDPMPGYRPDHLRSLMTGLAGDAPAPAAPRQAETPYVPPPVDVVPETPREQVAASYMHSLFTGVANDAPAVPTQAPAVTPYVPPPVDTVADAPPQQVAVDYWRSLFTAAATDAPTAPQTARPQAVAPAPEVVYVPEPPADAGQVAADYLHTVLTNVARDAPAPPQPPAPEPTAPEPISPVDQTVRRALWEAEL